MANERRLTKVDKFQAVLVAVEGKEFDFDVVDFLNHEIELLSNKRTKSGQTKTQKENIAIMDAIAEALYTVGRPVTITELQKENAEIGKYSNQKLSALLKKMVENGRVVKTVDKRKSYFSIVED